MLQKTSLATVRRERVWQTLVSSSLAEDKTGRLLFPSAQLDGRRFLNMETKVFAVAWGGLPPELAEEIYEAVLQVNPQWNDATPSS